MLRRLHTGIPAYNVGYIINVETTFIVIFLGFTSKHSWICYRLHVQFFDVPEFSYYVWPFSAEKISRKKGICDRRDNTF